MNSSEFPFQIRAQRENEKCVLLFQGPIDEDVRFDAIDREIGDVKTVVIDFADVTVLNSLGIRTWMVWLRQWIGQKDFVFRRCPKAVVDQFNVLSGFLPKGSVVESFYVPYFCDACTREQSILYRKDIDFKQARGESPAWVCEPKHVKCDICSEALELDVRLPIYFSFLSARV